MEFAVHVGKATLPGVGSRYDLTTEAGRHLSVVAHQDDRRILASHALDDDDACRDSPAFTPRETTAPARLLTPGPVAHLQQHIGMDLVTERIPVTERSPYAGRPLCATQARTRAGASVVAVLRRTAAFPSPAPDFRFAIGDTLVVGTREGADAVAELVTGG
jgi:TrkA domain protein